MMERDPFNPMTRGELGLLVVALLCVFVVTWVGFRLPMGWQ
jgi:hypothetical protein